MKVLWFTNNSSSYKVNGIANKGGGWISSLESYIKNQPGIELAISFVAWQNLEKKEIDNVAYYPLQFPYRKGSLLNRLKSRIGIKEYRHTFTQDDEIQIYLELINEIKPDLIHVFGSEQGFGLLSKHTSTPLIIHIQGILNTCLNAFLPPFVSEEEYLLREGKSKLEKNRWDFSVFKSNAKREVDILKNCKFFMGRTEWDRSVSKIYAPDSKYYHCDEMLRDSFWRSEKWKPQNCDKKVISTTISTPIYKGMDVILKTARILKDYTTFDFEWNIYGIDECNFLENKFGITTEGVNVVLHGSVDSEKLKESLLTSDIYVHPSYIDNSPNSVCEAQLLGMPVIACNVGGVSSIIEHKKDGLMVPANDPFMLVSSITQLLNDKEFSISLGKAARVRAQERHNNKTIIKTLLSIYSQVLEGKP